jgi:outer membrane protein
VNAKKIYQAYLYTGLTIAFILFSPTSHSIGISNVLEDPLRIMPAVIDKGPILPDSLPILCPPKVDLLKPLALADAVDLTLCNNPQIASAWAAIKIQAGVVGEARAAYLPTVNGSFSSLRNEVVYPDPYSREFNKGNTAYVAFNWRIFDFGGRENNRKSANALLLAALSTHEATIQKILANVIGSYFDVLTTGASVRSKEHSEQIAKETWQLSLRKERSNAAARNDVLQADAQYAKAQLASKRALGDYQKAISSLVYIMGLSPNTPLVLQEHLDDLNSGSFENSKFLENTNDLQDWLIQTQENHPAIVAARAQWEAAKMKVRSVKSEGLPTVDFVSNFYQNGYPNQGLQSIKSNTTTWGLTINIPFFEGFARTYKIRGAQAQAEQSEAQMKEIELQIMTEVVKSYADTQSSLANLASSERMLKTSLLALESSLNRFKLNVADIVEMLQAQDNVALATQERVRCLSEYRAAKLRLLANTGRLGGRTLRE